VLAAVAGAENTAALRAAAAPDDPPTPIVGERATGEDATDRHCDRALSTSAAAADALGRPPWRRPRRRLV
jgi:hypothetical protein